MSTLQFALFFGALLAGYVLVHLRMVRLEEHLRHLSLLKDADTRLAAIDERCRELVAAAAPDAQRRMSEQLAQLHDDLEDLRDAARGVGEAVVQIPALRPQAAATPDGAVGATADGDAAAQLVSLVEARLLQLGYRNLRLLGDLRDVKHADEVEVQVEAERNGMPYKGRVLTRNGSVRDVHMQTVAQSFP